MHPAGYEPMLATTGSLADSARYAYQPKLDGWRAILHVQDGGIKVLSRPGTDLTAALPELAAIADVVPAGTVLDGELVAGNGDGWSFYAVGPLVMSRPVRRETRLTFAAFDVLAIEGRRVTSEPFEERANRLAALNFAGPSWCTVATWTDVPIPDTLLICERFGLEGMVAKRSDSAYFPGQRRSAWVKIKTAYWRAVHAERRHDRS